VLYFYTLQQQQSPLERYLPHFEAAVRCQNQISSQADAESLAERYGIVLEELRLEAVKPIHWKPEDPQISTSIGDQQHHVNIFEERGGSDIQVQNIEHSNQRDSDNLYSGNQIDLNHNVTTPNNLMTEMIGWDQIDPMVSANQQHHSVTVATDFIQ
jgi:hypothetical protein